MNSANLLMRLKTEKPVYSIRLNGVNCGARYCVTRPDREGEDARARTQHLRVFHKHGLYHSAEHCKTVLSFQIIFVHFLFPVQNIALLCSIYTTVVLAVQRYLAISKPLEYYIDGATSAAGERERAARAYRPMIKDHDSDCFNFKSTIKAILHRCDAIFTSHTLCCHQVNFSWHF